MDKLELKIPPVAVFLILIFFMYLTSEFFISWSFSLSGRLWFAGVLFGLSGVIGIAGVLAFRQAQTTVNPVKPESASTVVSNGIFAYTRNPMYLALLLLLLAYAIWLENMLAFAGCPLFAAYMNRFQIYPEERALEGLFGERYLVYKQKVRRWI
ncbi:TPA: isoprenylcysteine carboxylmethyltransferase family protein [Vibrio vulnificus]|uniref:methyltransferase family protein n=1 Tax=Vibrio vulnificus TaxID=672 RepID=UPI001302C2FA|nr:isoprenylcysteine carboxylmethyltransferase family protein [Vibrio vulnificus]MCU8205992.1 isoprenylcysteine carboxylmethyltransferase family protein [Vibrio vulnificus]HAS8422353.1 isoprenylcysteine carboxylmethyltransferase family protein [Vibrio vulnificus]